jgi:3-oxoacyl-[acyl-carrier protein] reductase
MTQPDTLQPQRLAGKIALVFGGSRGIGAAIVKRLAAEGAAVAFTFVSSAQKAAQTARVAEAESGNIVLAIEADSASPDAIKAAVERTKTHFERIDIVVVNSGILIREHVDRYALEDFDRMLAVNVRGAFVAIQASLPYLGTGGRIITIGSNTAVRTAFPGASVYSMTKGAIASLVRGIAVDLAPRAITVNNVQPGPTDTDMNTDPGRVLPLIPLRRIGRPEEIAGLVAYLASPEAGFITGASVTIDGGYVA